MKNVKNVIAKVIAYIGLGIGIFLMTYGYLTISDELDDLDFEDD